MRLKHLSALFALSISLASCGENDALVDALEKDNATPQSEIRSIDEAYEIAAQSLTWFDSADSRSSVRLLPSKNEVKVFKSKESRGESSDTLMYVVNFQDEEGFAIVPANRNMPELLAVTESGSYDPASDSEVEPFNEYMKNAISVLSNGSHELQPVDTLREYFMEHKEENTYSVLYKNGPKVPYKWGQTGFEGMYCPNNVCGCSNLAVALCMAYFKYPEKIVLHHHNDSILYPDWDGICMHNARKDTFLGSKFVKSTDNVSIGNHEALGRICRENGYRAGSTYYDGNDNSGFQKGTSTSPEGVVYTLRSYGFKTEWTDYKGEDEKTMLNGGFMIVRSPGHMWVLDGYVVVKQTTRVYVRYNDPNKISPDLEPKWELSRTYSTNFSYCHHNWGWKGLCNGWFAIGDWRTDSGYKYDDDSLNNTKTSYNYSTGKEVIKVTL